MSGWQSGRSRRQYSLNRRKGVGKEDLKGERGGGVGVRGRFCCIFVLVKNYGC